MKFIQGRGYVLFEDEWMPLNEEKMLFPLEVTKNKETKDYDPLGFFEEFFKMNHVEHYLITYDEIEIEE